MSTGYVTMQSCLFAGIFKELLGPEFQNLLSRNFSNFSYVWEQVVYRYGHHKPMKL